MSHIQTVWCVCVRPTTTRVYLRAEPTHTHTPSLVCVSAWNTTRLVCLGGAQICVFSLGVKIVHLTLQHVSGTSSSVLLKREAKNRLLCLTCVLNFRTDAQTPSGSLYLVTLRHSYTQVCVINNPWVLQLTARAVKQLQRAFGVFWC